MQLGPVWTRRDEDRRLPFQRASRAKEDPLGAKRGGGLDSEPGLGTVAGLPNMRMQLPKSRARWWIAGRSPRAPSQLIRGR